MRKLIVVAAVVVFGLALPGHARAIGQCGLPSSTPVWIDFGTPQLEKVFARAGVNLAVSTGDFPARMRNAGARTVYWDMNLNNRVGTPAAPADPNVIVERANRLFDFAAAQSGCDRPLIALNELFGAHLETPWSATNAVYRENVLTLMRTLAERGARPFLLLSTAPYTGSAEAVEWWRQAASYGDLVLETYFGAPSVYAQGPVVGNRRLRSTMRRELASLLAVGIPKEKLGLVLGFQTARGTGGREGLRPREAWFEYVKWNALAARQVARELGFATIWSWGWATYGPAGEDADKQAAACVYMWTRDPRLCDGLRAAGPRFNASRTEGQLIVPAGLQCAFGSAGGIRAGDLAPLQRVTGDRDVAFAALLARVAEAPHARAPLPRVLAAEQAVIALRFGGSRAAYTAALARAGATVAVARSALADEVRRRILEEEMRARRPAASAVTSFYFSYPDLLTRAVALEPATTRPGVASGEAPPGPWWLGGRTQGLALSSLVPEQVFRMPEGRPVRVRTLEGTFTLRALGEPQPLGSVPLEQARPAIATALAGFGRRAAFEEWTVARQTIALKHAVCRRDVLPSPGTIRLTSYLPFLSLTGA